MRTSSLRVPKTVKPAWSSHYKLWLPGTVKAIHSNGSVEVCYELCKTIPQAQLSQALRRTLESSSCIEDLHEKVRDDAAAVVKARFQTSTNDENVKTLKTVDDTISDALQSLHSASHLATVPMRDLRLHL